VSEEEEAICQKCGKRRATWLVTDLVDGKAVRQELCEECYKKQEHGLHKDHAVFAGLIAAMVPELKEMALRECPQCGLNYLEFRQTLRLGCPHDYEAFGEPLEQLLERIHGSARHSGKVATTAGREESVRSQLRSLRRQQQRAIAEENYELAAELRDRMKELEEHGRGEPEG
jgi:protein arginine kinase activator